MSCQGLVGELQSSDRVVVTSECPCAKMMPHWEELEIQGRIRRAASLTNAVLALVDSSSRTERLMESDRGRSGVALHLLIGFLRRLQQPLYIQDWFGQLPSVLAAVATALSYGENVQLRFN